MAKSANFASDGRAPGAVEVISDWSKVARYREEWNRFADSAGQPLCRFEWFEACYAALGAACDLCIVVVKEKDRLLAVAPLVVDRSARRPRLRPLDHFTFEPSSFPIRNRAALEKLCSALFRQGIPVEVQRLAVGGAEITAVGNTRQRRGVLLTPNLDAPTASVRLSNGWSSVEKAMSTSSRSYIRRKRRIAEKSGELRLEVTSPDENSVDGQLAEIFRVEAAGWKSRAGTAVLSDQRMKRFLTTYGRLAAREKMLRLFFLKLGEETIAVRMAVEFSNRIWELKIGFDERWGNCSPGILLADESLRYACQQGIESFEFLGVSAAWQKRWPVEYTQYKRLYFYPYTLGGAVSLVADATKIAHRRIVKRLPAKKRKPNGPRLVQP